ncbi:MAG: sigma-70 family RNA polymerase sigma factor [Planctomycetota bacterium]
MNQSSDADLIELIQQGDRSALGTLLDRHQQRLFNVALRMVSNRDDAAEITQDAMLKICEHIDNFRSDAKITTWMTRIVMNLSISLLRKRKVRNHISLESSGPATNGEDAAASLRHVLDDSREPGPAQSVETTEMLEQLKNAIGRLDDDFRAVLVLRDIDQMDYQQIAETLDLKTGTVKSRLFRARLALRQEMQKLDKTPSHQAPH